MNQPDGLQDFDNASRRLLQVLQRMIQLGAPLHHPTGPQALPGGSSSVVLARGTGHGRVASQSVAAATEGSSLDEISEALPETASEEAIRLSKAIADHPEAAPYLQQASEFPADYFMDRFEKEGKGNPFFHLYCHAVVQGMREAQAQCREAYQVLFAKACKHAARPEAAHNAEHALIWILAQFIWEASHLEKPEQAKDRMNQRFANCVAWDGVPKEILHDVRASEVGHNF